jgi:hypothetical protein
MAKSWWVNLQQQHIQEMHLVAWDMFGTLFQRAACALCRQLGWLLPATLL